MTNQSKIIYFFISFVFFMGFDLYFSELILASLRFKFIENPFLDLIFVQNTGAAFSILENSKMFLIVFSIIALFLIFFNILKNIKNISIFSLFWSAMLLAGIGCNLWERIEFGYVRDFFKLNFIEFPVFNISDVFINIGVLALIFIIIKNRSK